MRAIGIAPLFSSARTGTAAHGLPSQKEVQDVTIRITCLEEHVADPALAEVSSVTFRQDAPYWFDQGVAFHDDPELQRMDDTMPPAATGLRRTISQTYREQVYVTPSGMLYLSQFTSCREVLGTERIMFAVDYPYLTMTGARRWLEALPVPEPERLLIVHGNAEALLRLG